MAARALLLGVLFIEVSKSACAAGVKGFGKAGSEGELSKNQDVETNPTKRVEATVEIQPSGHVILGKKNVALSCLAETGQDVLWLRNGISVPPCGPVHCVLSRNGSLLFYKKFKGKGNTVLTSTKDEYRCIAKSFFGGSLRSSPTFVQIAELAHNFKESPEDTVVWEGEIARLSCHIDSVPSPPNITWQHNGVPVLLNHYSSKYSMVPPGVLYISATKISDAGSYRCIATNEFLKKTKKSREAKLTVVKRASSVDSHSPASLFPQISYNHLLHNGSDLSLVCAASGYPSPFITWTFVPRYAENVKATPPRVLLNSTVGIGVLFLKDVTVSEAGFYLCSMKNAITNDVQMQNITVDVLVPPTFLKKPSNQICPNGRTARFECQAHGLPVPRIYWLKDSMNITINGRRTTYAKDLNRMELAITATVPSDSGLYQCVAVNPAGEVWAAGRLQVNTSRNSPAAPTSLACNATSPVTIVISWEPPRSLPRTSITAYTVHYSPVEGGKEEVSPPEPGNSTSVEVTNLLEPFTNYSFYVRVWSNYGASDQSAAIKCSTAPSVPKSAPKINVEAISSTKLNVSWLPLSKKEARGIIVEYKLQVRVHGHPSARVLILPASIEWYILSDLTPGEQYDIRVLAKTEQGWPNIPESQLAWTTVTMPLSETNKIAIRNIIDMEVVVLNASIVKVKWRITLREYPNMELDFDTWQLYCENSEGQKIDSVSLPRNVTEYLFTDLGSNLSYTMGLCMSRSGQSTGCIMKHIETARSALGNSPLSLEAIPVSSTSVNLTWTVNESETKFNTFELCYNAVHATEFTQQNCTLVENTTTIVDNLKPFTLYQFKVRTSHNDSSQREVYSESVECYTNEDVPGKVEEVEWFLGNNTKVRIAWKEPSRVNGVVRSYLVAYATDFEDSTITWTNVTVPGNRTSTTLPGLLPGKRYFVMVQALTRAGYGKPSEPIIVITGGNAVKTSTSSDEQRPPKKAKPDQSLGIILGVSISVGFIVICLCSIYCRRKCEDTRGPAHQLKGRGTRNATNGNGRCAELSSASATCSQAVQVVPAGNEIEMAVLCPASPVATNPQSDTKGGHSNGTPRSCLIEPLLSQWEGNSESKDVSLTDDLQYKRRDSGTSGQQEDVDEDLERTRLTSVSCASLNNNSVNVVVVAAGPSSSQKPASVGAPTLRPNG